MPKHLLTSVPQFADGEDLPFISKSSGLLSASGQIATGVSVLVALVVLTDGVNNAVATIYDNTAASGTVLAKVPVIAADQIGGEVHIMCQASIGLYLDLSGTGANAIVRYID